MPKKKNEVITEPEVKLLLKDWYERDPTTFTKLYDTKVGWQSKYGGALSRYKTNGEEPSFDAALKSARKLASTTLAAMSPSNRLSIQITDKKNATNGRNVYVSAAPFGDKGLSTSEMLDVFVGATIHEGCHVLYTDFHYLNANKPDKIIHHLWNIIEDERIERKLADEKPGLSSYIAPLKKWYFKKEHEELPTDTDYTRLLRSFFLIVRYPLHLEKRHFEMFGKSLQEIKDVMIPHPDTTMDAHKAAIKVWDIIKTYADESDPESNALSQASNYGDAENYVDQFDAIENADENVMEHLDKVESDFDESGNEKIIVEKEDAPFEEYHKILETIRQYIPRMKKELQYIDIDYELIHRGRRTGILDDSMIAEAYRGNPNVFSQYGEIAVEKVAVCLLVDLSGSMNGKKIESARRVAVLLNESFKDLKFIDLYIYGHTADIGGCGDNTTIKVYREGKYKPKSALASMKSSGNNRDGVAIETVAKKVRENTKSKCLMFVISDGAPNAHNYYGDYAVEETRKSVIKVEKNNFDVVQIAIDPYVESRLMFKHHMQLLDMDSLPKTLGSVIKNRLKNQKITIQ